MDRRHDYPPLSSSSAAVHQPSPFGPSQAPHHIAYPPPPPPQPLPPPTVSTPNYLPPYYSHTHPAHSYAGPAPPALPQQHPPPPPLQQQQQQQQQQPQPQHQQPQPPPPAPPPPPPPSSSHPPQAPSQQRRQSSQSAPVPALQHHHSGPPVANHTAGGANLLPPIHQGTYSPSNAPQDQAGNLRYRDSTATPTHDPRDPLEQSSGPYNPNQQPHSGHATPTALSRPYSHDSTLHQQQRTPNTPVGPPHQFPPPQQQQQQSYPQAQPGQSIQTHPQQQPPLSQHPQPVSQHPPPPPPQQQQQQQQPLPPQQQTDAAPLSHRPPQMDHGLHPNYPPPNGVPHGMPPPGPQHHHHDPHQQQQYMPAMMEPPPPPPPPPPQHHHYSSHPGPPMYGPTPYGPTAGNMYNGPRRGKTVRATQACEQCRSRKQKCDEGNPCAFCKENNLLCQYRDTPPAKTDKNMEKLFTLVEGIGQQFETRFDALSEAVLSHQKTMRQIEMRLDAQGLPNDFPTAAPRPDVVTPNDESQQGKRDTDHRVGPHKLLLLWPSIRPLLQQAGVTQIDSYVVQAEDRGTIRLWTRGEGNDDHDWVHSSGPASPAQSDISNEGGTVPTPIAEGVWGSGFPLTPSSDMRRSDGIYRRPEGAGTGPGGLKPNGDLDLDPNTVRTLYDSYMKNIHIMHPFLDKRKLWMSITAFLDRYGPDRASNHQSRAGFLQEGDHRPLKRQRSNGSSTGNIATPYDSDIRRETRQERSPTNAVIYLVLALGKITMHRDPLPPPLPDNKPPIYNSVPHSIPSGRNLISQSPLGRPSPTSPKATPNTQPTPPSETGRHTERSRRSSTDNWSNPHLRNVDVVPGLAYYAKAAEILGDQADGNDLIHAQMFLLAGLYKGQLARVRESHSWFRMSGRAILYLCDRYKLYNTEYWKEFDVRKVHTHGQELTRDQRRNQVVLAAWTSMQLEGDILAEMPYPPSGLLAKEDWLIMPNRINEDEDYSGLEPDRGSSDENFILMAYSAQLYLRKRHNQIHRQLYGSECQGKSIAEVQAILEGHEHTLAQWRQNLPPPLRFEDDDEPSTDLLLARLQGKYWGGKYIINRPFLDYALHYMHLLKEGKNIAESATDAAGNWRHPNDVRLFDAISRFSNQYIGEAVARCIHAAMKSTLAFDGLMDKDYNRLCVTNIHGTAHAQFGNILVLAAVHESSILKHYLSNDTFKALITRTIKFLSRLAPISPTLANDAEILEKFYNHLFAGKSSDDERFRSPSNAHEIYKNEGVEPEVASTTTSFSGPAS